MKYDAEYNSYKFSPDEITTIVNSLVFYQKYYDGNPEVVVVLIKNLLEYQNTSVSQ
jgi:hypothetical protein